MSVIIIYGIVVILKWVVVGFLLIYILLSRKGIVEDFIVIMLGIALLLSMCAFKFDRQIYNQNDYNLSLMYEEHKDEIEFHTISEENINEPYNEMWHIKYLWMEKWIYVEYKKEEKDIDIDKYIKIDQATSTDATKSD